MLFEKVLKRLCPCYYARSDENEQLCSTIRHQKEGLDGEKKKLEGFSAIKFGFGINDKYYISNKKCSVNDTIVEGNCEVLHPQPLYSSPFEKIESTLNNKNFLWAPLCWRKNIENFRSEKTIALEELKKGRMYNYHQEKEKDFHRFYENALKHNRTVADATSIGSQYKEIHWLRSQSLNNLPLEKFASMTFPVRHSHKFDNYYVNEKCIRNWKDGNVKMKYVKTISTNSSPEDLYFSSKKLRVIPDISYGVIVLSAAYYMKRKLLLLKIERLENLSLKGRYGNSYGTIIKITMSPSHRYIKCTKLLKKSAFPEVKEEFCFPVKANAERFLRLSVFDAVSQNYFNAIGHAILSLDNFKSRHTKKFKMKLYRHTKPHVAPGNLALALGYLPEEDKFTVLVDKAKNLTLQKDKNVKLNTYVKATLYCYGSKLKSKRSSLVVNSKDPNYNCTFTFHVKESDLEDLLIVMSVRLKSFLRDATVGRVILGPFFITGDKKLTPWGRVFLKREFVSHWFRLYL